MPSLDEDSALLQASLAVAVPLWIEQFKHEPWTRIMARRETVVNIINADGDKILFRGKKAGETAAAFNALAQAIAILSFWPGGVKLFGGHWEAQHPEMK